MGSSTPNLSVKEKQEQLKSTHRVLRAHLLEAPGAVLNSSIRLAVAKCAQTCTKCKGCDELPMDACLMPGAKFFEVLKGFKHDIDQDNFPQAMDIKIKNLLTNLVHAIVRHQNRLDKEWYDDTIKDLQECNQLNLKGTMANTAFCEIVTIASMSHGVKLLYTLLEEDAPDLPSFEDLSQSPQPMEIDITKMLKTKTIIRNKECIANAPYILTADVDQNCPEFAKIPQAYHEKFIQAAVQDMTPFLALSMSPIDLAVFNGMFTNILYLGDQDFIKFNSLNPRHHCAGVTRFDLEIVATEVARTVSCGF